MAECFICENTADFRKVKQETLKPRIIRDSAETFHDGIQYYLVFVLTVKDAYQSSRTLEALTANDVEIVGIGKACAISLEGSYAAIVFFEIPPIYLEHEHTYGDWTATKDATCTEKGEEKCVCSYCGDVQTRDVAAFEHAYSGWSQSKAPKCGEKGEEKRTCSNCGDVQTRDVDALEHNYGEWIRDQEPSATEVGHEYRECVNCNHREEKTIPSVEGEQSDEGGFPWIPVVSVGSVLVLAECIFIIVKKFKR